MPELPEVETVVRTLEHQILGDRIEKIDVLYPNIIDQDIETFKKNLLHQHFRSFLRRGKYLLFKMDTCYLIVHLRMEGKFYLQNEEEPLNKHIHVVFTLKNHRQLRYCDTRKFGRMETLPLDIDLNHFKNLGPEPFDEAFNEGYIKEYCRNKTISIKETLLQQNFVAGVGNIYADEILFACGIKPTRTASKLTKKNREDLIENTRRILTEAIRAGGTTIRSYTSSLGVTGLFQLNVKVHTRKDEPCVICGTKIKKIVVGGRGTYYCPQCQKR